LLCIADSSHTQRFGLKTIDPDFGESGVGIWVRHPFVLRRALADTEQDGKEFLYQTSTSKSRYSNWYDSLTALRRYGPLSPFRTQKAISALLVKFANLYNPEWLNQRGAAKNIEEFAERVGLGREYTTRRGDEWATGAVGVNKQWAGEVWDSSTRVNVSDCLELR
jgi:prenylcysteine oxidase/farnesylcysteine lyase